MTAIDFPDSPTIGDTFTAGDNTWEWTGVIWKSLASQPEPGPTGPTGPAGDIGPTGPGIDGVTATAEELNILDGATLTTTELNYVDGVTSAIQDQLDDKAPIASPSFTGQIVLSGKTIIQSGYTSADTQITSLIPGSTFGGLVQGVGSGHIVFALQDNDTNDSLSIISGGGNYTADNTLDTAVARFMADGRVILTGNLQGGTTWTSATGGGTYNANHSGETVRLTGATEATFTLGSGLPAGHRVDFIQDGTGQITFSAGSGVTLKSKDGNLKTAGQYSAVSVLAYSTTEYYLVGDLAA